MNLTYPAPAQAAPTQPQPHPEQQQRTWPRRLINVAVALIVVAVAAATFVLSYPGVHAIALQGGVSARLARVYPGIFDAVLVIACVATAMLRDGRWWARCWAWLVTIVVLAAIGAADVTHATTYSLPQRETEGAVAAAPVVLVLFAFSLLITLLRSSRTSPTAIAPARRAARRAARQQPAAAAAAAASAPADVPPSAPAAPAATEPEPPSDSRREQPPRQDYWEADDDVQLAGQVYPVEAADTERDSPAYQSQPTEPLAAADAAAAAAAPFETPPLAAVPRLNRVRVTPTPPEGGEN